MGTGREVGEPTTGVTGIRVTAVGVGRRLGRGREVLRDVSLTALPGQVTALAGGSGAGKSVLLEVLAGIRPPTTGRVWHDGAPPGPLGPELGFVPQEDILHRDLPLRRTLEYAARLRLPAGTPRAELTATVDRVLATLGLTARAAVRVGALSGGERKRASIAVELLTRPRVLFLDEPTSGLDPAAGAELMATLTTLAAHGTTVVLTSHTPADLLRCAQVVFLTPDGRTAYSGPPQELCARFSVATVEEVYGAVARGVRPAPRGRTDEGDDQPAHVGERPAPRGRTASGPAADPPEAAEARSATGWAAPATPVGAVASRPLGPLRQWLLLTRRNAELMLHSRLTAAVLAGSPLAVVAMFAVLFRPGAFDPASPSPHAAAMILFWIAFGGFFFGLTYGLSQICTELPVVRRERLSVLRLGPYLASKLTVVLPLLAAVDALLLVVLRALDRLPAAGWEVYGSLFTSLLLSSTAALALGLAASAAVTEPGQATLLLPLLCFPQVLFSGAFVPVPEMAWPGRLLSAAMSNRWAFEALGSGVDLAGRWATGVSPLGPPLLASYGDSFAGPTTTGWAVLAGLTVLPLAGAWALLARACRTAGAGVGRRGRATARVSSAAGG